MEQLNTQLRGALEGTFSTSESARTSVRRDGSIFEIIPDAVFTPATVHDIKTVVTYISAHKAQYPKLALTPRGAGTDMSGAAVGSSIILDTTKLNLVTAFKGRYVHAQPGAHLYGIQRMLSAHSLTLGSAPASQDIATIGGMVANNAAGSESLVHGSTQSWVRGLRVVLADGNEYTVRSLTKNELDKKMAEPTYEGRLYAHLFGILDKNYDIIRNARPHTARNATGYNLWDVWDREAGRFDLTQLFTGSQGTLGIITDVIIEAVKKEAHKGTVVVQIPSVKLLDEILKTVKSHNPLSIEGFDDLSFTQALRSQAVLRKQIGNRQYAKQQLKLFPSTLSPLSNASQLLLVVELSANTEAALFVKLEKLYTALSVYKVRLDISSDKQLSASTGRLLQSTAALIQSQVSSRYAAPFIDDMSVHTSKISSFIPALRKLIKKHKLPATIHGDYGSGVFHILPLSTQKKQADTAKIESAMRAIISLVTSYEGTISASHGDGMIRGPWLQAQYSQEVYVLFKKVKELFDPLYIFNPHKKTDASWEYSMSHLSKRR